MLYKISNPERVYSNPTGNGTYLACQTKWALHTLLGVDPRRRPSITDDRDRGKAMHVLVEAYVRHYAATGRLDAFDGRAGKLLAHDVFEKLHASEGLSLDEYAAQDLLAAARTQLPKLGLGDFEVCVGIVDVDGNEIETAGPLIELDLKYEIDGHRFQAIVDAVLVHKLTGKVWLVDWKTTIDAIRSDRSLNFTYFDYQLELQRMVLEAHGVKVDHSALVQIRSQPPKPPPLTAKTKKVVGSMKSIACDAETYRAALVANGEDPDTEKAREKLKALEHCVFVRWLPDITPAPARAQLRAELHAIAGEMQATARGERAPISSIRNVSGHHPYIRGGCGGCRYGAWCRAATLNGGEPDWSLIGVDYIFNDKTDRVPSEVMATQRSADEDYKDFALAYGVADPHASKTFKP